MQTAQQPDADRRQQQAEQAPVQGIIEEGPLGHDQEGHRQQAAQGRYRIAQCKLRQQQRQDAHDQAGAQQAPARDRVAARAAPAPATATAATAPETAAAGRCPARPPQARSPPAMRRNCRASANSPAANQGKQQHRPGMLIEPGTGAGRTARRNSSARSAGSDSGVVCNCCQTGGADSTPARKPGIALSSPDRFVHRDGCWPAIRAAGCCAPCSGVPGCGPPGSCCGSCGSGRRNR